MADLLFLSIIALIYYSLAVVFGVGIGVIISVIITFGLMSLLKD